MRAAGCSARPSTAASDAAQLKRRVAERRAGSSSERRRPVHPDRSLPERRALDAGDGGYTCVKSLIQTESFIRNHSSITSGIRLRTNRRSVSGRMRRLDGARRTAPVHPGRVRREIPDEDLLFAAIATIEGSRGSSAVARSRRHEHAVPTAARRRSGRLSRRGRAEEGPRIGRLATPRRRLPRMRGSR
jgi:hypothetical protein